MRNIQGRWEDREYPGQPQTAGCYLYEPGGSVHTFFCPVDNTEDTIALACIDGTQVSFSEDGAFHSVMDAVSLRYLVETAEADQGGRTGRVHAPAQARSTWSTCELTTRSV